MRSSFHSSWFVLLSIVALTSATMLLNAAPPATAPSFAIPMDALRAHKEAIKTGDADAFARCYICDNEDQTKAVKSIARSFAAMIRLREACIDKFGPDQAKRVRLGLTVSIPEDAYDQVSGDTAKIYNVGGAKPLELKRVDGQWKMTYASLVDNNFRDLPKLEPNVIASVFEISTATYKSLADDTKAGKFNSATEANDALSDRRNEMAAKIQSLIKTQKEAAQP